MNQIMKCPKCGNIYTTKIEQCSCGWDFTVDVVNSRSMCSFRKVSSQFKTMNSAYSKDTKTKVREMTEKAIELYKSVTEKLADWTTTESSLQEAEKLLKEAIRLDGNDNVFEWFGKVYMQRHLGNRIEIDQEDTEMKEEELIRRERLQFAKTEQISLEKITEQAKAGDVNAQFKLGYMYQNAEGIVQSEPDYYLSVKYYRMAAHNGHRGAIHNLGTLYYQGLGVPQDLEAAYRNFFKAAKLGETASMIMLGRMYENGTYVTKDLNSALYWYQMAYKAGVAKTWDDCRRVRSKIAGKMD